MPEQARRSNNESIETDRRRHRRDDSGSVAVGIDGVVYRTVNWSLGGVLIEGYAGPLGLGSLLTVTEMGQGHQQMQRVRIRARVMRHEAADGTLAIAFLGLDDAAIAFFQNLDSPAPQQADRRRAAIPKERRRPSVFAYADRWPPRRAPGASPS